MYGGAIRAKLRPLMKVQRVRKAYEQVADQLIATITSGELRPGDRLPSEAELAAGFGVSRTTVREAMRILQASNLITTRKGMSGGHFVVPPNVEGITDYLVANYGLLAAANRVTLGDLLAVRDLIEPTAASLAARHRDDEDLAAMRRAVPEGLALLPAATALAICRDFHLAMLYATKNQLLVVAAAPIFTVLQSSAVRRSPTAVVMQQILEDHLAILSAIEDRDPDQAESLMREHLQYLRENYRPGDPSGLGSEEGFDLPARVSG